MKLKFSWYGLAFAIVDLVNAILCFLMLGQRDSGLTMRFASWYAKYSIMKKKKG